MYEITFTGAFKDGLERLPKAIHPIIDRQLRMLSADPFAKNPNATRMKNAGCSFRARIGAHVRMLYRVQSKQRRVVVLAIGTREHIYEENLPGAKPLAPSEVAAILAEISGAPLLAPVPPAQPYPASIEFTPSEVAAILEQISGALPLVPTQPALAYPASHEPATAAIPDIPVTIEQLPWITDDELFFLHVEPSAWSLIVEAGSVDGLRRLSINDFTKTLIEDYWTHPSPTQVEKLYGLSEGQGAESIAQQPLSYFLIALDPDQKEALKKIKTDGPYLLRGSAGTGKSLVGLYHIRDLIHSRSGETLFDGAPSMFGVITYTNTLVDANKALLQNITSAAAHAGIHCSTLDKIAFDLAARELQRQPQALNTVGIAKWIQDVVEPQLQPSACAALHRIGHDYIAEEIEKIIHANGISTLAEYLSHERAGRKRGLSRGEDGERVAVWQVHEKFSEICRLRKVQTFEEWRVLALRYLKKNPGYPRFTALFVDEAQDLSKVARQLCLELVKDPRYLLLAADSGQSIYSVPPSWIRSDPRFNFNRCKPIKLERSYRSTWQIGRAIAPLRLETGDADDLSGSANPVFSGPQPQWIQKPLVQHVDITCELVKEHIHHPSSPIHPGQIAIIVRDNGHARKYQGALANRGINAVVVAKGSPLQISQPLVHIITAHSSKGLGFPVVFVPEVEASTYPWNFLTSKAKDPQQREQTEEGEQRLLYVALSRASHRLHMIVDSLNPSPFVAKLDREAHWS
jgi:superfamily I DNA/RNA helicase/mRNA-degrading endonuclease RelE of RelBE toxin-antitoxin system